MRRLRSYMVDGRQYVVVGAGGTASGTSSAATTSSPLPSNDLFDGGGLMTEQKLDLTREVGSVNPDTYRLS